MVDWSQDIHSLSAFKRHSAEFMKRMKKTGRPMVLTVNRKAEMVIQDAAAYRRLCEMAERAEMLEFLRQSREDLEADRTISAHEAMERLAKKYKIRRAAQ